MHKRSVRSRTEGDDTTHLLLAWSLILCLANLVLIFGFPAFARAVDWMGLS